MQLFARREGVVVSKTVHADATGSSSREAANEPVFKLGQFKAMKAEIIS